MCHPNRTKVTTPSTERCSQKRHLFLWSFLVLVTNFLILSSVQVSNGQLIQDQDTVPLFQFNRGGLITTIQHLRLDQSPFNFYEDIIISKTGKLVVQAGVILRFASRKGIHVHGSLVAVGSPNRRIQFTRIGSSVNSQNLTFQNAPSFGNVPNVKVPNVNVPNVNVPNVNVPNVNVPNVNVPNVNVPNVKVPSVSWGDARLVDGDSPNEGRLQLKIRDKWYSVCTNSRNWTQVDIKIICNQIGFHHGSWYRWFNKFNDSRQLMIEQPACLGTESTLEDCPNWNRRQIGSGTCDYHSDIGIRCTKRLYYGGSSSNTYSSSSSNSYGGPSNENQGSFWSGISFINAENHEEYLVQFDGRLKRRISDSILDSVDITYAGEDLNGHSASALSVKGIPPQIFRSSISLSPATGINITDSTDGFSITDTLIHHNRAYGLFINSTWGQVNLHRLNIHSNGADGIRYNLQQDLQTGDDFCYFSNLGENQVYPVRITHEQKATSLSKQVCCQEFKIRNLKSRDVQLTVHFPYMMSGLFEGTEERDRSRVSDGFIQVFDGYDKRQVLKIIIRNETKIPSITSTENRLSVCYHRAILKRILFTVIVTADFGKAYDLNITRSMIKGNNGRGIWVQNQRSGTVLNHTIVSNNSYIAGIHIASGVGDLIVNNSHIAHNQGDGVNASLAYGCRHIDRSEISMNTGRGVALWTNESVYENERHLLDQDHPLNHQNQDGRQDQISSIQTPIVITQVTYSEIWGNLGVGLFISNVCRSDSFVNISMNGFKSNHADSIEIFTCHETGAKLMTLFISNNKFIQNHRLALRMAPVFNLKRSFISHNLFHLHSRGCLFINNQIYHYDIPYHHLPVNLLITDNIFTQNTGLFVISLGLLEPSSYQQILFSHNILERNIISHPFPLLNPRSRVPAVLVVSSSNTRLIRNNFINPASRYEIASHLDTHHSAIINASFNYYGDISAHGRTAEIYDRIFDRKNRYNLAQIEFLQYRTNPYDFKTNELLSIDRERDKFIPFRRGTILGGEVRGQQTLDAGVTYTVVRDIFVRPGSHLIIEQGATLVFDQSVGMMVQGKLDSIGSPEYPIKFTGGAGISNQGSINPELIDPIRGGDSLSRGGSTIGKEESVAPSFIDTRPKDVTLRGPLGDPIVSIETPISPVKNDDFTANNPLGGASFNNPPDGVSINNPLGGTSVNNQGGNPFITIRNPRMPENESNPDNFAAKLGPGSGENISIVPKDAWTREGGSREGWSREGWTRGGGTRGGGTRGGWSRSPSDDRYARASSGDDWSNNKWSPVPADWNSPASGRPTSREWSLAHDQPSSHSSTHDKWPSSRTKRESSRTKRESSRTKRQVTNNIRLSDGHQGRLEVNIGGTWGSVCSYGFDINDAAIACQQMGLVLNSRDWLLERSQFMSDSSYHPTVSSSSSSSNSSKVSSLKVIISNLRCSNIDTDILTCKSESLIEGDLYNSCLSSVGIKCYSPTWSGIRLGITADESTLSHVIIQHAGLLDYSTHSFKPALQIDFHRHRLSSLTVRDNSHIGIGFMWNDIFSDPSSSLSSSLIYSNQHHGIETRTQGLRIHGCNIHTNQGSGFHYDPLFTHKEQTDLVTWIVDSSFIYDRSLSTLSNRLENRLLYWPPRTGHSPQEQERHLPQEHLRQGRHYLKNHHFIDDGVDIKLDPSQGSYWYLRINSERRTNLISWFTISTAVEHSLGIMVLNPSYGSDLLTLSNPASDMIFDIKTNLSSFPLLKYSYKLTLNYSSGATPRGDIILYISVSPLRNYRSAFDLVKTEIDENKRMKTIKLSANNFHNNYRAISTNHYNQNIGREGEYYHRHSNETIEVSDNVIFGSLRDSLVINSPLFNDDPSSGSISEINITLINNNITRNGKGINQYSRDMRSSNNLFHIVINSSIIDTNYGSIIKLNLPYVWSYNENFTHSVSIHNNSILRNRGFEFEIDGFFSRVNITDNVLRENHARDGLMKICGMEKEVLIQENVIELNHGHYMIQIDIQSHADQFGSVKGNVRRNTITRNRDTLETGTVDGLINMYHPSMNMYHPSMNMYHPSSYTLAVRGVQYINITQNLLNNPNLQFELVTGILTGSLDTVINAQYNWWASSNYSFISQRIFDFDDWNSYAIAHFSPYLTSEYIPSPSTYLNSEYISSSSTYFNSEYISSSSILSDYINPIIDTDRPFGGRLHNNLFLRKRKNPYIISSDLTVMPGTILSIESGVQIEFFPSVGILVLGEMTVAGYEHSPVIMKPARLREEVTMFRFKRQTADGAETSDLQNEKLDRKNYLDEKDVSDRQKRQVVQNGPRQKRQVVQNGPRQKRQVVQNGPRQFLSKDSLPYSYDASDLTDVRLCITESCSEWTGVDANEVIRSHQSSEPSRPEPNRPHRRDGYLEVYNKTSLEWISVCDPRFTERNAQVVCSFLGHSILNVHMRRGRRVDMNPTLISRVRYWPEPLQCSGKEHALSECEIRLNGYGNHSHACSFDGHSFIYIYCGSEPDHKEWNQGSYSANDNKEWNQGSYSINDNKEWNQGSYSANDAKNQGTRSKLQPFDSKDEISDFYWGGIRFAQATFEQTSIYQQSSSRPNTGSTLNENLASSRIQNLNNLAPSRIQHLRIIGAGILHGEKSAALQMVNRDVSLEFVNISHCASHGIEAVAPSGHLRFSNLNLRNNLGSGINYILLGTASTSSAQIPYKPLTESTIPYHIYGLVNICDPNKNLLVQERVLLYYKYDNQAVDCVKIFKSARQNKQLGFRMLQFNLFNSTNYTTIGDSVKIYDGDIFNQTVKMIGHLGVTYGHKLSEPENRMYVSSKKSYHDSLSVRLHASGASYRYGFVGEVVTLPSSYFVPRGFCHNLTYSSVSKNTLGGVVYKGAGEVGPSINVNMNRFEDNCEKLLDNFTTCESALEYEVENTPIFRLSKNLLRRNQGGVKMETNAQTAAGALNAFLTKNLFDGNMNNEAISVSGPEIGAQQIIEVSDNYFCNNHARYKSNIVLKQVVANLTRNIIVSNHGLHQVEILGIENSFQTICNNWIYNNHAYKVNERSTLFASNPGQLYSDNYLVNPENDFELATLNRSFIFSAIPNHQDRERERDRDLTTFIDATNNWWGFNQSTAILSRILDASDYQDFIRVHFFPFHQTNRSVLSGICPGGWERIGESCILYIGSRMTYKEGKEFCESEKSSMPVVWKWKEKMLTKYVRRKEDEYESRYSKVWVQSFSFLIEECTVLSDNEVRRNPSCDEMLPFLCEKDPDINVLISGEWLKEPLGVAAITISTITFTLTLCCICCWLFKSREKSKEKLKRRNSIRASIRSNRSFVASSNHSLNEIAYKRQLEKTMSRNPNGGSQQLRSADFNRSADHLSRSTDDFNSNHQHPGPFMNNRSRGTSFDSLDERSRDDAGNMEEMDTFRSSEASLNRVGAKNRYEMNKNGRLEDRFANDPVLENANVSMMVHPTFDLTFENEAFREGTPSGQSRTSDWTTNLSPRSGHFPNQGHFSNQDQFSNQGHFSDNHPSQIDSRPSQRNGHTRHAPAPPVAPRFGPSARLIASSQVAPPSPSSIGHFSRRSPSPPLPDNRFNTYETFKSMGGQSSIAGGQSSIAGGQSSIVGGQSSIVGGNYDGKRQQLDPKSRKILSTFQSAGSLVAGSDFTSASGARAEALTRQIREQLSIRDPMEIETPYLETSLDGDSVRDNAYDYCDYNQRQSVSQPAMGRFSPSVSMTTIDSSKEQPLETAM